MSTSGRLQLRILRFIVVLGFLGFSGVGGRNIYPIALQWSAGPWHAFLSRNRAQVLVWLPRLLCPLPSPISSYKHFRNQRLANPRSSSRPVLDTATNLSNEYAGRSAQMMAKTPFAHSRNCEPCNVTYRVPPECVER